jgi:DNA-binding GntR family transcriptional regulator
MAVPRRTATPRATRPLHGASPIAFRTIAEQIAGSIREAIAQGRISPAARLLEATLAREMGTSRAPVREAISQLEREGLVVKEPNRGARVVELTEETVREVASLRGLLEGFAASLAAAQLTAEQFTALEAMVQGMERAVQTAEYAQLVELDYQFHDFICQASGHRTLYETWSAISGKVRLYLSTTNLMYRDLNAVARGHGEILAVLRTLNPVRANRVIQEHLGEMLNDFVATLPRASRHRTPRGESATFRASRRARRLAVARLGPAGSPRGGHAKAGKRAR